MALAKAWALGFAVADITPFRRGALVGALAGAMARALTKFGVSSSHPSESMVRENCTLLGDGWLDGALAAWAAGAQNDADHGIATLAPSAAAVD
jgi:hypothetical protein